MKHRKEEVRDSRQSDLQGFAYLKPVEGARVQATAEKAENVDLKDFGMKSTRLS